MKRLIFSLLLMVISTTGLLAQDDPAAKAVSAAMGYVAKGDWVNALHAARGAGQVGVDIVDWHRLRASAGEFSEYQKFLDRRADWPGLPLMRKAGEWRIPRGASSADVIAYFEAQEPRTGTGALRLADAHYEQGANGDAEAEIVRAWREIAMRQSEEAEFLKRFGELLKPHHAARQDMLLWDGKVSDADRLTKYVSSAQQKLARARIALIQKKKGVDGLIAAVPKELQDDPGLAYARFAWRIDRGLTDGALEMLQERSTSAEALGQPEAWADRRRSMARELMRSGDVRAAYDLASSNFLESGRNYTDLEWLAGFIALTDLDQPEIALEHFQRFRVAVDTPISLGRAGYWEGRAHEALGDVEAAQLAYEFGAEYQTSFYGQLAAERAGLPMDPALTGREAYPDFSETPHADSSVLQAALLFHKADYPLLFTRFTRHLAEILTTEERGALAQLALDMEQPFAALYMAKYAADNGTVLMRPYFPITDILSDDRSVPAELTLSIARRESEFYPASRSPVGARGLMQLMPRTAEAMAQKKGLKFQLDRLISDPKYNATLGSAYLAELIEEFDGYYPMIAAGYNAGPSRPKRWARMFGDPRRSTEHAIDWVEHIPFRETRNYVMRVMESLPVYRARLSGEPVDLTLGRELTGG